VPDAHAGRYETSIELALGPGRVRTAEAEPGNPAPIAELMPVLRAAGVRAASGNGVLGDPTGASVTEGASLLDWLEASLLAVVTAWLDRSPA
jgi:creatinine amidohydrolase/Fe(II)-dependent formamide hydrolase-like protein